MIEAGGDVDRARDVELEETEFWVLLDMRQITARAGDQIIQAGYAVAFRQ